MTGKRNNHVFSPGDTVMWTDNTYLHYPYEHMIDQYGTGPFTIAEVTPATHREVGHEQSVRIKEIIGTLVPNRIFPHDGWFSGAWFRPIS
ncbi:MAG: hypothetical protein AB7Q00_14755 [Phycisphaerales bacterium]